MQDAFLAAYKLMLLVSTPRWEGTPSLEGHSALPRVPPHPTPVPGPGMWLCLPTATHFLNVLLAMEV